MFRPTPCNTQNLICDICGKPAKWYDRVFYASYRLGEALCGECAAKEAEFFSKIKSAEDKKPEG